MGWGNQIDMVHLNGYYYLHNGLFHLDDVVQLYHQLLFLEEELMVVNLNFVIVVHWHLVLLLLAVMG